MGLSIVPLHVPFDVLNTDAGDERMAQNDLWIRLRGEPDTMETGRWSLSRSESSFVHIPLPSNAPFACGLLAARKWLPAEKRTRLSEVLKWRVILDLKTS
jgi:hypothetical protein